jgi:type I restriction enzyme, S subunit
MNEVSSQITIPGNWSWIAIGEIAELVTKGTTPTSVGYQFTESGVRFVKIENIRDGRINLDSIRHYISETTNNALGRSKLHAGDILFSIAGTIGACAIVDDASLPANTNQALAIIRGISDIVSVSYFKIVAASFLAQPLKEKARGGAMSNVSLTDVREFHIPLPPLAEQRRIVAKIEELFSELDAGEESLRQARRQLGVYRQSLLKQAFEGKLTEQWRKQNPDLLEDPEVLTAIQAKSKRAKSRTEQQHEIEGWSFRCLDELTEFVTSGSRGWADYYSESGSLFIRAQNLNRDYLNLDDIAFVQPPESAEGRRTMVRFGDLLITITGANTTKAGWVHLPLEDAYVSQHVALCRPVSDTLSPFLYRYIISEAGGRKRLIADAYGAGKPGLNLDHVRSLVIPIPTLPEQHEIVRLLDEQFTVIEQNEREIDAALKRSTALRQSILKKAFTGQLVPQDPTDEPASALLERIRQERELVDKSPKKKRAEIRR